MGSGEAGDGPGSSSLRTSLENTLIMAKDQKYVSQAAVVAVRDGRICLITSSSGKRWLVPKGNLQKGRDLRETAAQEAWEEAGLVGCVRTRPLGSYQFIKLGCLHEVVVFRMRVRDAKRDWPERRQRQRRWMRPQKAAEWIAHEALREIVLGEVRRRTSAA
jgi:8-oxo-dGTP pyrophosphatase MutT (NUDIX family)